MKIVLATGNAGKVREIQMLWPDAEVLPYKSLVELPEIEETGKTFKENAIIKAETVAKALNDPSVCVLADDSGISVPLLGGEPGIYSARYAGVGASDQSNLQKLINTLKSANHASANAYYTAAIAIVHQHRTSVVHGWMHGQIISEARGDKGFGYDPMFIPDGYDQTLGELEDSVKKSLSHRSKALQLAKKVLAIL